MLALRSSWTMAQVLDRFARSTAGEDRFVLFYFFSAALRNFWTLAKSAIYGSILITRNYLVGSLGFGGDPDFAYFNNRTVKAESKL